MSPRMSIFLSTPLSVPFRYIEQIIHPTKSGFSSTADDAKKWHTIHLQA
jgi:hypothetical protein